MKGITLLLVAVVILAGIVAFTVPEPLHADDSAAPIFVTKIPPGYRDWRLISVSHEAGNLNSIGAVLGIDGRSPPTARGSFHTRTARSSPLCTMVTSRRRKTTRSLATHNLSSQARPLTFSLWSTTPRSTPRRAAGGSLPS
jgi:hypothetical protein